MKLLSLLVPIVALLGLLDASYLTYEKLSGITPACSPPFDCGTVLHSPYASIGPIPLSVFGMVFYSSVLVISSLHFGELRSISILGKKLSVFSLLRLLTWFGFLFSLYLIFLMGVILQAWCLYCLISALTSFSLFVLTSILSRLRRLRGTDRSEYPLRLSLFALAYEHGLKRVFFLLSPELIHNYMVKTGSLLGKFSLTQMLTRRAFAYHDPRTSRTINGIYFPNPIGLSAGFDYDADLTQVLPDVGFGFMTIGTVTRHRYDGNPHPMLTRLQDSQALLVNKGFKSLGAKEIIRKLTGQTFRIPVGISIGSTNKEFARLEEQIADIVQTFELFERSRVSHSYYELNISCPNTKGGQPFTDAIRFGKLTKALTRLKLQKPVYLKMPIDLGDGLSQKETEKKLLIVLDLAAKVSWISGVICGNLTKDHENPTVTLKDRQQWKSMKGGVSGKPTFERSNALIRLVKKKFGKRFVIIGTGGIFTGEDALEKINAGADLVQLITGMIYKGPQVIGEINWTIADTEDRS